MDFGLGSQKTNLIIVCTPVTVKYGQYLMSLISSKDDQDEMTTGLRDGAVKAAVLMDKEFNASLATFSSDNYILFIGGGRIISNFTMGMVREFEKCGMFFESKGKRAHLDVTRLPFPNENNEFFTLCREFPETKKKTEIGEFGFGLMFVPQKTELQFEYIIDYSYLSLLPQFLNQKED
jgi:hypothetical protein